MLLPQASSHGRLSRGGGGGRRPDYFKSPQAQKLLGLFEVWVCSKFEFVRLQRFWVLGGSRGVLGLRTNPNFEQTQKFLALGELKILRPPDPTLSILDTVAAAAKSFYNIVTCNARNNAEDSSTEKTCGKVIK